MSRALKTITLILLVCVVSLFFFQIEFGSFQSTHGPTVRPGTLVFDNAQFVIAAALLPTPFFEFPPVFSIELWQGPIDLSETDPGVATLGVLRC